MNPFLERMGYGPDDRVLITHIDDMGFCHAANTASLACLQGSATCASVLTVAPWFLEAAAICREHPDLDVGVHLTLTAEYDTYRWPALSTRDPASGLLDGQGQLWHTREDGVRHVTEAAAAAEMRAQIDAALAAGINVTHIDTHMGTVVHPKFLPAYIGLAAEYGVPAFLPNITRERLADLPQVDLPEAYVAALEQVDAGAVPTLDEIIIDTLVPLADKRAFYEEKIRNVRPGLTHLLFHPAEAGVELDAITAGSAASRNADFEAWRTPALRDLAASEDIHLIGYAELKQAMP